jgi:hypothetical protein
MKYHDSNIASIAFFIALCCITQQEIIAQSRWSLLDTSTFFAKREFSVSWALNRINYRKPLHKNETGSTWRRYNAYFSADGDFNNTKTIDLKQVSQSINNSLYLGVSFGKEKRRSIGQSSTPFLFVTGLDYFGNLFDDRLYSRRKNNANNNGYPSQTNQTIQRIGLGMKPFFGFRYQFNRYLSICTETSVAASVFTEHRKNYLEENFETIESNSWRFGYHIFTHPIDAIWLTLTF